MKPAPLLRTLVLIVALWAGAQAQSAPPPPVILPNVSTLTATLGAPFSVTFTVQNPPSTAISEGPWSINLQIPGLTLNPQTGQLSGTPTTFGQFGFTVSKIFILPNSTESVQRFYTLVVSPPEPVITTASLPEGFVGAPYSYTFAAANAIPPLTWSVVSGSLPPGLSLSASSGQISGTPSAAGLFTFVVRVSDYYQASSQKEFTLKISQRPSILTQNLPAGELGSPYSYSLEAQAANPVSWSLVAGSLPSGLSLSSGGLLSGTPAEWGQFTLRVRAADASNPQLYDTRDLTLEIRLPPLPELTASELGASAVSAQQPRFGLSLSRPYPADLAGQVVLEFQPDPGLPDDPAIRFANGQRQISVRLAKGQTALEPADGSQFAFQTGTVAGVIILRVTLTAGGQPVPPAPALERRVRIEPAAPSVQSVRLSRTQAGFEVLVTAYSNTREVSGVSVRLTPSPGANLASSEFAIQAGQAFTTWFSSETSRQFGGQFLLTIPFTVTGRVEDIASVQVTLSNARGSANASGSF
ncbi:MAG: Ig domain-containing protein [Bryobacteraceae bacterium]